MEASQKIGISQPALSESLSRLEEDLGATLFYRSRSGIELTSVGREFVPKVHKFFEASRELEIKSETTAQFGARTIILGCHETVAQYTLPSALQRIASSAPDYRLEVRHDLSRNIQLEVQRGKIDLGIVINPVRVPDLVVKKIGEDEIKVWRSPKSFDQNTVFCHIDLFQTQAILRKWKTHPERIITSSSFFLIGQMVEKGLGYGIMPSRHVSLFSSELKAETDLPTYKDEIALVHRPEFGKAPVEQLVKSALLDSVK